MAGPPWLADEMVGRLARYLRFLGQDTSYARGLSDDEVAATALQEHRVILTRDRELARRVPGTLLLHSTDIAAQLREVHAAAPAVSWTPCFERCTECNGHLRPVAVVTSGADEPHRFPADAPLFRCEACGHLYWEGTHSQSVRRRVGQWLSEPAA